MKFKKVIIITFLLLAIFTLSAVSANENLTATGEGILQENPSQEIELSNDCVNGDIISSSEGEIISEKDDGTFTALQNKINNAQAGSTITLENDYAYDEDFNAKIITINKDLTINGNGHKIDAKWDSRIFKCGNNKITLNDIDFYNGRWYSSSRYDGDCRGGAIYSEAELEINNCNFIKNEAYLDTTYGTYGYGGAIYSTNTLILSNCKFEDNLADSLSKYGLGGAIYCKGNTKITNCIFNENSAGYNSHRTEGEQERGNGGAIYNTGVLEVHNSKFTKNKASYGIAICNSGTLKAFDSTFSDKQSQSIDTSKDGVTKLSNCKFDDGVSPAPKKLTPKLIVKTKTFKVKTKIKKYAATLKTNKNKAMKKVKLYLKVKGKTYAAITTSKGKAIFKIKNLNKKGTFKAKITFKGNKNYKKVTKSVKIKVK